MTPYRHDDVVESWRKWMLDSGLSESQVEWFIKKGYSYIIYLWECTEGYDIRKQIEAWKQPR